MKTRGETILCWAALPLGFSAAYLTVLISEGAFNEDPIYSYFYGFLAFLAVQLGIALWLSISDGLNAETSASLTSVRSTLAKSPKRAEVWLTVRLSRDAADALQALMAAQENNQSEGMVIDHLLIKYQKALRKKLLGDW